MSALARLHAAANGTPWPRAVAAGIVVSLSDARELIAAAREGCPECLACHNCGATFCTTHAYGQPGCDHREPLCRDCIGSCRECSPAFTGWTS